MKSSRERYIRLRITLTGLVFSLFLGVIGTKAVYLQVIQGGWLAEKASGQYQRTFSTSGSRGTITDINGKPLAVSGESKSIAANPSVMTDPLQTAASLASALGMDADLLGRRLSDTNRRFVWIKRHTTPAEEKKVRAHGLTGIEYIDERCRYYPKRQLAAQILGFTGVDGSGLEGLEFYYDQALKADSASMSILRDALGRRFETEGRHASRANGNQIVLTIDESIQHIAERELERAIESSRAKTGMAVVMKPHSGAVLAMVNYPFFNPNVYGEYEKGLWRNRTVTDRFEPGSTMKIFSAAAAVEFGGYTPASAFYCEDGAYHIGQNVVNDTKPYGWLTLREIIKFSSNIGAVKLGENIGPQSLHFILSQFGFGSKTGIDFPGETSGRLAHYQKWAKIDAGAIAFGQGIAVTALQLATATGAIANNGLLMKPYIVKAVKDPRGNIIQQFSPQVVRQVISRDTARIVTGMMRAVVEDKGTGTRAALVGYTAAGKTGTAQKIGDDGTYSNERFTASFVGFAPATRPEIVILVVIDEPQESYYGGTVAAPVFRRMAQAILDHLNVPPDANRDNMIVSMNEEGRG